MKRKYWMTRKRKRRRRWARKLKLSAVAAAVHINKDERIPHSRHVAPALQGYSSEWRSVDLSERRSMLHLVSLMFLDSWDWGRSWILSLSLCGDVVWYRVLKKLRNPNYIFVDWIDNVISKQLSFLEQLIFYGGVIINCLDWIITVINDMKKKLVESWLCCSDYTLCTSPTKFKSLFQNI